MGIHISGHLDGGMAHQILSGFQVDAHLRRIKKAVLGTTDGTGEDMEPLIDEETFLRVHKIGESRRTEHNNKCGKFDSLGTRPNILKELVYCAECGRTMARYKSVSQRYRCRYYTYICHTHMENPSACPKRNLHETVLMEVLWDCLQQQIILAGDLAAHWGSGAFMLLIGVPPSNGIILYRSHLFKVL